MLPWRSYGAGPKYTVFTLKVIPSEVWIGAITLRTSYGLIWEISC